LRDTRVRGQEASGIIRLLARSLSPLPHN
jgi:hypothetical protein